MARGDWEADDDWLEDEEGNDLDGEGDSPPPPGLASAPVAAPPPTPAPTPAQHRSRPGPAPSPAAASTRVLKVKPMSKGMRIKWPDVSSCLLTLSNGRQVMFVRQ
jgi:hypothetical protein